MAEFKITESRWTAAQTRLAATIAAAHPIYPGDAHGSREKLASTLPENSTLVDSLRDRA
ncbi:hypothetical protein [Burkholderia cepacia]|uniref:hypothetical protein n=1 Tax=Burkholderia cepacia TaxID=292 RepID=UPI002AB73466|nr:hypothetical protein [Burkholderia cepacia]